MARVANRKPRKASKRPNFPMRESSPPLLASRQHTQNIVQWLRKPVFIGICLAIASFRLWKPYHWTSEEEDSTRLHQDNIHGKYLDKHLQIYGKYGLIEPTIIPDDVDTFYLKERPRQDTPIVEYYLMNDQFVVPPGFEQNWPKEFKRPESERTGLRKSK
ncbi:hypothetical protein TWF694_009173 [Orbilia ellipsospora]|uniref:Uncharacterized protein n=1 Tax=Orbilia ellipsospora TaxID=2528407 RepID=A0AAV9XFI7_9PEZI